jgi:hypothetical protein
MKTHNCKFKNWRVDDDGMLRVTARVLKEGVFPYLPEESPEGATTNSDGMVDHLIPADEFTPEALHTLEGKPVIIRDHVWRDVDNTFEDGLTVGAVAGTPRVEDGYVVADFVISDADTVKAIEDGALTEVSAAYDGDCIPEAGIFEGVPYATIQRNLRFNHVLLLPSGAGRCGHTVGIVNTKTKQKETTMKVVRQFGNRRREFAFQNEEDAREAENMAEEERKFNADELATAMANAEQLKNEIEEKQKALDEALETIEEQKAEIDKLMSAETQEAMAQEAAAQTEAEDAILEEAVENEVIEEEEKEEVRNECRNCKTFADRRRVVVQNAMKVSAADLKEWSQDAVDGAFETLHRQACMNAKRRTPKLPMGGVKGRVGNSGMSNLQRILRPMKLQNGKAAE